MKEYQLGKAARLQWTMTPAAILGSLGLWLVIVALMTVVFNLPIGPALLGGIIAVILHWFSEVVHQLGHAWAARRTGYPMTGVRFGTFGIFATGLYPADEPALPANLHIRRAIGGPIFSAWLASIAFIILLMVIQSASAVWQFVLWFFFLENLIVFTLQVFLPLGFNDGATIWHWLRHRPQK
jgi:hypothetical protein